MNYITLTHPGKKREYNEDSLGVCVSNGIYIVADGMGGHLAGEVASSLAVEAILKFMSLRKVFWNFKEEEFLRFALIYAHNKIIEVQNRDKSKKGMGTTCVITTIYRSTAYIGWSGDSRAYLLRDGKINSLTKDHSFVQKLVDSNIITKEEALFHPKKHIITHALGLKNAFNLSLNKVKLKKEDKILLCTDGLTDMMFEDEILSIFNNSENIQAVSKNLLEVALARGGNDNISFIIIEDMVSEEPFIRKLDCNFGILALVVGLMIGIIYGCALPARFYKLLKRTENKIIRKFWLSFDELLLKLLMKF